MIFYNIIIIVAMGQSLVPENALILPRRGGVLREEYELIYRKYYRQVYLFLFKLCGDRDLAEDLTQETFYQAYVSIHRFRGDSDMFTFIAAIGKHIYYKHLRKNRHSKNAVSLSEITDSYGDDEVCSPEYICERAAVSAGVKEIINKVPEKYRDVVIYRIYAGMSFAQIASVLNITENSAKVIFFRAKKLLLKELKNGDYV